MSLPDDTFLFGRVIVASLGMPMPEANLVYLFDERRNTKNVPESLTHGKLLIPPIFVHKVLWTRGYFETVDSQELRVEDVLPQHCFWDVGTKRYVDTYGDPLEEPTRPVGSWGLVTLRGLDDRISAALGIPPVRD